MNARTHPRLQVGFAWKDQLCGFKQIVFSANMTSTL